MIAGNARQRSGRVALALLAGLMVGGWVGGGLVWFFNRTKFAPPGTVIDPNLTKADELDLVPPDALGFAHARVADLWKAEGMADFRKLVDKAGPDALKLLDDGFIPAPSTLDRVTVVMMRGIPPVNLDPPVQPPKKGGPMPKGGGGQPPKGGGQPLKGPPPPPQPPLPGFPAPGQTAPEPQAIVIFAFSSAFDEAKFREANLPDAEKKTAGGKDYWVSSRRGYAAHFPGEKLLVVGQANGVEAFLSRPVKSEGPLSGAIKLAAGGTRHIVAAVNMKEDQTINGLVRDAGPLPQEVGPILSADSMAMSLVFGTGIKLEIRATYRDEAAAEQAEKAVRAAADAGRKTLAEPKQKMQASLKGEGRTPRSFEELPEAVSGLLGLGAINWLDEFLENPPIKRNGTELVGDVTLPSLGDAAIRANVVVLAMLAPAVQKVREAAGGMQGANNLKQLGLAMLNFESANGSLPLPAGTIRGNQDPKTALSWRVHILPYLGHGDLFEKFKLDEPWDSDHNKALIDKMPPVFASPRFLAPPGQTYYKLIVGGGAAFDLKTRTRFTDFTDGTSNTIMIVEGGDPVIWTKPEDLTYAENRPLPKMSMPGTDLIQVAMGDASVRSLNLKLLPEKTIRAMITRSGGEVVDNPK